MADSSTGMDMLTDNADPKVRAEADRLVQQAEQAEQNLDRWSAIELYEKAFELTPDDPGVCFRLAYHLDLVGEEGEAIHLYEQCCQTGPARLNALINLAILYEDAGQYANAEKCLRQVIETDPNHQRARLFMKDIAASRRMVVDEDQPHQHDRQSTLLETPVTDFELSVRARNCLKKMNIRTLGDLLRTTEAELLAYKNFGETSLQEIKAMLAQKGLRLGQGFDDRADSARQEAYEQLAGSGNEQLIDQPVTDLDLSVRARKALSLLGIERIGELVARTEAELLGIKNFGETSLQEIKEKLHEQGLALRQLDDEPQD